MEIKFSLPKQPFNNNIDILESKIPLQPFQKIELKKNEYFDKAESILYGADEFFETT